MLWPVFVSVYYMLSYSTVPVTGQCTVSSGAVSVSGREESLHVSLDEHDHRLETINQNMRSAFEKLERAVNRTNARSQEELYQDLKTLYYNMSVNLERVNENFPERLECHATQEQEEYLSSMNLSLASMIVRTNERIQTVNENLTFVYQKQSSALQTLNQSLDEQFQLIQVRLESQSSSLQTVNRSLDEKFQMINDSVVGTLREHDQKLQALNETLSSAIDKINAKLNSIFDHVSENIQYLKSQDHCRNTSVVCDCSDIKANGHLTSKVYRIYVVDEGKRYYADASCDMTTTNGAWTVFQRRKDGSVDFNREWNDYENGFGIPNGEFWLGNKFIHLLTSKRRYRLRIDLEDYDGGKRYAEYSTFDISSSADKYRLSIGNYSGTAGDSLSYHNGQRFSTKDNDNDAHPTANCALVCRGAWWYQSCYHSNLNALYSSSSGGVSWRHWRGDAYSLKTTEMKISYSSSSS